MDEFTFAARKFDFAPYVDSAGDEFLVIRMEGDAADRPEKVVNLTLKKATFVAFADHCAMLANALLESD